MSLGKESKYACDASARSNEPTASLFYFRTILSRILVSRGDQKAYFLKKVLPGVEITISAKVEKKVNSIFVFKCKINGADGELLSKATLSLVKPTG